VSAMHQDGFNSIQKGKNIKYEYINNMESA
jgi:hypothetical protein